MASAITGMLIGMTLSLGFAVVMERVLFRAVLKCMFSGPRLAKRLAAERQRPRLADIRNAGL